MPDPNPGQSTPPGTPPVTPPVIPPATPPGQSTPPTDWRPEELRGEKSLDKFKDPASLAKSYIELEKRMGTSLSIPKDDAPPEEWEKFYAKTGRPESPEKYEIKRPEKLPDGMTYDENLEKGMLKTAHSLGISKKQMQGLLDAYNAYQMEGHAQSLTQMEGEFHRGAQELKQKWGPLFTRNLAIATRTAEQVFGADLIKLFEGRGLANNPLLVEKMAMIGRRLGEDEYVDGQGTGINGKASVQAKIDAINADKKHPYWDDQNPGHKAAVEEMSRLFQMLGGM